MMYFSQNDPRWKDIKIGKSPYTLAQKGCTTSVISTAGTWFGEYIHPGILSTHLEYTQPGHPQGPGLIIWTSIEKVFKTMKFEWRFYKYEESRILEALKNTNKVCLLNINGGAHWVFLLSRWLPSVYREIDPLPYPAKKRFVTSRDIVGGAVLVRK